MFVHQEVEQMETSLEDCRRSIKSHNNAIYSTVGNHIFSASHFCSIWADFNSSVNLRRKMRREKQRGFCFSRGYLCLPAMTAALFIYLYEGFCHRSHRQQNRPMISLFFKRDGNLTILPLISLNECGSLMILLKKYT